MEEREDSLELSIEQFGPFGKYIEDEEIIDIRYNGQKVMVRHEQKGSYLVDDQIDSEWAKRLAKRISDKSNKSLNSTNSSISVDIGNLRISIINDTVCNTGNAITIRKTGNKLRMNNKDEIICSRFCEAVTYDSLQIGIEGKLNAIIIGETGSGKTETIKHFARYIPNNQPIVTLEDAYELRLEEIYPDKYVIPLKTKKNYGFHDGIMDAMRCDTKYFFMSEARGAEAKYVLAIAQSSTCIWTSIHAQQVYEIPDKLNSMLSSEGELVNRENEIYSAFDLGIKIRLIETAEGIKRNIEQLCVFERFNHQNNIIMIVDDGQLTGNHFPDSLMKRLRREGFEDPFARKVA